MSKSEIAEVVLTRKSLVEPPRIAVAHIGEEKADNWSPSPIHPLLCSPAKNGIRLSGQPAEMRS
jgi:hypothetical protein